MSNSLIIYVCLQLEQTWNSSISSLLSVNSKRANVVFMTYSELTIYVAMSAVPRLLADTVHNCRRGSSMQERTWERKCKTKP